ncbi:hypothetical protein LCL97_15865 [Seohaeicola saemankumensis]|nr:hypothetical protein [Seohaeicola saemankumensis]MCA0872312.1 hypothetical protein [Seohaeicola saemankumensis]
MSALSERVRQDRLALRLNAGLGLMLPVLAGAIFAGLMEGTKLQSFGILLVMLLFYPCNWALEKWIGPPADGRGHLLRLAAMLLGLAIGVLILFLVFFPE